VVRCGVAVWCSAANELGSGKFEGLGNGKRKWGKWGKWGMPTNRKFMCVQYPILGSDYPSSPGKVVDGDVIARHKYSLDCLAVFFFFPLISLLFFFMGIVFFYLWVRHALSLNLSLELQSRQIESPQLI